MRAVLIGIVALCVGGLLLCIGLAVPLMIEMLPHLPRAAQGLSRIFDLYWSWAQENPVLVICSLIVGTAIGVFINVLMIRKERANRY